MNYEEFYSELQVKEKSIKDIISRQKSTYKSISKNAAYGDLKSLAKYIAIMGILISDHEEYLCELKELVESFNAREYMHTGDFAKQMLSCCEIMEVDVIGDYPSYEIFPYKVRIDEENQDIYIDRKKLPCSRPEYLVSYIKQNREKLLKVGFSASTFLSEVAYAYDNLSIIKRNESERMSKKQDIEISLKELHRFLAPMQRFRREYDMKSFAFDLARLYASDIEFTEDGRQFKMGPARTHKQNIRILDKNGNETWVGTIKFYSNNSTTT